MYLTHKPHRSPGNDNRGTQNDSCTQQCAHSRLIFTPCLRTRCKFGCNAKMHRRREITTHSKLRRDQKHSREALTSQSACTGDKSSRVKLHQPAFISQFCDATSNYQLNCLWKYTGLQHACSSDPTQKNLHLLVPVTIRSEEKWKCTISPPHFTKVSICQAVQTTWQ